MDKIAIIILNKSNNTFLFRCINSIIEKTSYPSYNIYIGDTGSTKQEIEDIKNFIVKHDNIFLIHLAKYHFATNHNYIIKNELKDEEVIVFCNNDVFLIDDCLTEGMKMMQRNKNDIGTVGFKLLYENETIQHAGQILYTMNNHFYQVTHRGLGCGKNLFANRNIVLGNTMALLMTFKKTYEEIGGLCELYKECFEDVQYNLECILNKKHNVYIGDKTAWHYESQTRKKNINMNKALLEDANNILIPFIHKNMNTLLKTKLLKEIN